MEGFLPVTVLVDDPVMGPATAATAATWVDYFDVTYTVLADEPGTTWPAWRGTDPTPLLLVLDRDLTVMLRTSAPDGHTRAEAMIRSLL